MIQSGVFGAVSNRCRSLLAAFVASKPPGAGGSLLLVFGLILSLSVSHALAATNHALGKSVTASTIYQAYYPSNAVDGIVSDASRWLGNSSATGNWIEIDFAATVTIQQAHVYSGYQYQAGSWLTNLLLQAWSNSQWTNIPGATTTSNNAFATVLSFSNVVTTAKVRLVTTDATFARLREITIWDVPVPLYTGVTGEYVPGAPATGLPVLVNQIGYQVGAPKRFAAPLAADGTAYSITATNGTNALFSGTVAGGRADFSAFDPVAPGPYLVRVGLPTETNGVSYPFLILSNLVSAKYTVPAARFMVDSRSGVGTHPSAFGGCPWRDGTYYSFEVPSLVYLLLNDRETLEALPRDVSYAAEKERVLATNFSFINTTEDSGFLAALRRYYTNQPPPLTTNMPDAVQCIHFGLGVTLERPATRDWSGDERPRQIHAQTVEWCAYFLHAWPVLRNWLDDGFYRNVRDFAFAEWSVSTTNDPSSLEIDPLWAPATYGTVDKHPYKGRHPPGHSILPNLLMYQVARREGRSDAAIYLAAAQTQARWIIDNLDWSDPRTTKGHRMSELKMMPGLAYFLTRFPQHTPAGLAAKIQSWAETMVQRSENPWDFRMYETNDFDNDGLIDWTLPTFTQRWNEPGNLAGFPACALPAKFAVTNAATRQRLTEISWAAMDCLFGRNPLNATSASRPAFGFPDAENGWTPLYTGSAGYLELCRGALASGPATEHFPYKPAGAKRHHEGWVNFNAAWNVGIACLLADLRGQTDTLHAPLPIVISEVLPAPGGDPLAEYIELHNPTAYPARLSGLKVAGAVSYKFPTNVLAELAPGARCLLVRNSAAFTNQFGAGLPVDGSYSGDLPDSGAILQLGDVNGNTFATVELGAWVPPGFSAVLGDAWQVSSAAGGSPGTTGQASPGSFTSWREGVNEYTHAAALIRGDSSALNSGARDQLIVGRNTQPLRSVLSFPLSGLPAEAIITGVTLDLWTAAQAGFGTVGPLELRRLTATPVEGMGDGSGTGAGSGVTWVSRSGTTGFGNAWVVPGADFAVSPLSVVPGFDTAMLNAPLSFTNSFDLVNAAQDALNSGQPLDLMLLSTATESGPNNVLARIHSDDAATLSYRPRLTASYSTDPGPFSLKAWPEGPYEVALSWRENLTNETGFLVERRTGTNAWDLVATTGPNVTNVHDSCLASGTSYEYRVRAPGSAAAGVAVQTPAASLRPPVRILPLGDSITLGASAPAWVPGGYRSPLHTWLTNAGYEVQFLGSGSNNATGSLNATGNAGHEGHGGYTTIDMLVNLDASGSGSSGNNGGFWLDGIPGTRAPVFPDVILLLAGVNDLGVNQWPPEQGLAGLRALVDKLATLRPAAWVIVSTLPPYLGTTYPQREQHQQEFNAALPALVSDWRSAGRRVALCDIRSRLNLTNAAALLSSDGVHPNQDGYNEIAQVWLEAFQQLPLIENWRRTHFGSPAGSGNRANGADWDDDGRNNLAEWFLGTDPARASPSNAIQSSLLNHAGTNYLSIRFPRRKDSEVRCVGEAVSELSPSVSWTGPVVQVGAPVPLSPDLEQITFRDTTPSSVAPSRFLRLRLLDP